MSTANRLQSVVGLLVGQRKGKMETYEIWKNKRLFAEFTEGDKSRFGKPFSREIAQREFDSCVSHWEGKGVTASWELRGTRN